jgi:hypothetical protein
MVVSDRSVNVKDKSISAIKYFGIFFIILEPRTFVNFPLAILLHRAAIFGKLNIVFITKKFSDRVCWPG